VQHRAEHQRLIEDLENLDLPEDDAGVSLIVRYLQEWLLRHVHGADKRMAAALLAKADFRGT
jgi:hemerythrin